MTKKTVIGMTIGIPAVLLSISVAIAVLLHGMETLHLLRPALYASLVFLLGTGAIIVGYTKFILVKEVVWPTLLRK